jgi:hypothetical protein
MTSFKILAALALLSATASTSVFSTTLKRQVAQNFVSSGANPKGVAMRRVTTILLTAVLGSSLFMASAVARDSGEIGFGRHTNYHGLAVHHQRMHGLGKFWRGIGHHAYHPHCATSIGEESKYPPWSFC